MTHEFPQPFARNYESLLKRLKLRGMQPKTVEAYTGAVTVLHTHNRRLDFHPHVHLVMPSVAFDARQRLWRNKNSGYLFNETALAKVFRAKMLGGIKQAGLKLPERYPEE